MSTDEIVARRDRVFGRGAPLFYETPLTLVRGDGVWLEDTAGRRYLDMYNNIPVVGHCNPRAVEAHRAQASTLNTHSRYLHPAILDYGERLLDLHADPIDRVVFTCTGTEANEAAMLMARIATGGRGFICTDSAYHGHSALVGLLTRAPRRGRPDVHGIPFPQRFRPIADGLSEEQLGERYLAEVAAAIDDFATEGVPLAGLLVCPILANEGLPDIPAGFMARAASMVRAAGGIVIADEVQAGFCRTGGWWGYEAMGLEPDIVTMGKPMGNGLPLGACAGRAELVEGFRRATGYFNTFAASPVHGAVGMAVLDELAPPAVRERIEKVGSYLRGELETLAATVPAMGDVRGHGLFLGIDWVTDAGTRAPDVAGAVRVVNGLKDRGVLVGTAGALGNMVKIRPPLVFERAHADVFLDAFRDTLASLDG